MLEAGWRSGSLNTAHHATVAGRPVGAVPGPVTSAASAGCHRLIREANAVLVTNAEEMAELAPLPSARVPALFASSSDRLDAGSVRLLDALSFRAPRAANDIAARSGLSVVEVGSLLGQLELAGLVEERERGWLKSRPAT